MLPAMSGSPQPVRLYIVRHGKAQRESPSGRDRDRALKPRGQRQAQWLGDQFLALRPASARPSLILSSPFTRAIDTATIIRESLDCPLRTDPLLETGHDAGEAADLAARSIDAGAIALVGHNPQLEELLWLLATPGPGVDAPMRTGEAAILEFDAGAGLARRLGRLVSRLRLAEEDDD